MRGLFVTATDTGVGKTMVAAALIRHARRSGLDVGGMKPAESGCGRDPSGELIPADALLLREAAGGRDPLSLVCPFRFEAPLAPGIAAALEGKAIDWESIEHCFRELGGRHPDGVVVEGAGGLLVPFTPDFAMVAELAIRLDLPALVVARAGLGTINHVALTVEALSTRKIACRGIILSASDPETEKAAPENARAIERITGVPVLATIPHIHGGSDAERIEMISDRLQLLGQKLDPRTLLA